MRKKGRYPKRLQVTSCNGAGHGWVILRKTHPDQTDGMRGEDPMGKCLKIGCGGGGRGSFGGVKSLEPCVDDTTSINS